MPLKLWMTDSGSQGLRNHSHLSRDTGMCQRSHFDNPYRIEAHSTPTPHTCACANLVPAHCPLSTAHCSLISILWFAFTVPSSCTLPLGH
jgi:hypothetical protein